MLRRVFGPMMAPTFKFFGQRMQRLAPVLCLMILIPLVGHVEAASFKEQVFINGKVITVNNGFDIVEAVAIRDGRFLAVGTNRQALDAVARGTEIVDLNGRTVVPGFVDAHAHMDREGLKFILPSLQGVRSIEEILAVINKQVESRKPGEWIVTMPIGDYPEFDKHPALLKEKRYPTRWDLDKVAPNNPVYIRGRWLHWGGTSPIVSIANSAALKLAGITRQTQAPYPGLIIRKDAAGEPNGIFEEPGALTAIEHSLLKVVPRFSHEDRVNALMDSMRRYNAVGTTSIYEAHGVAPSVIAAYRELHDRGKLTVRAHLVMSPAWDAVGEAKPLDVLSNWASHLSGKGLGDDQLRMSGIYTEVGKSVVDDIRRKDSTYPGWSSYSVDVLLPEARASLFDLLLIAARTNIRAHAITFLEKDIDRHLQILEKVNEIIPLKGKRFVMQHVTAASEKNQDKMVALGIVPTVEPSSITDAPLHSFVKKGIPFAIGTDNIPLNPLYAVGVAVTRLNAATGKVVAPEQRVSREQALRAMTINGAYLSYEEDKKGSIEVGKLADMVVLSEDFMKIPAEQIGGIKVLMTLVGGEVVFKAENLQ